jgi:hypothetical protein
MTVGRVEVWFWHFSHPHHPSDLSSFADQRARILARALLGFGAQTGAAHGPLATNARRGGLLWACIKKPPSKMRFAGSMKSSAYARSSKHEKIFLHSPLAAARRRGVQLGGIRAGHKPFTAKVRAMGMKARAANVARRAARGAHGTDRRRAARRRVP